MRNILNYDDFKGVITETSFNRLCIVLESKIDYYTFNRINYENEKDYSLVKDCLSAMIYTLADEMKLTSISVNQEGQRITSQSVGELKESYYVPTLKEFQDFLKSQEKYIYNTIKNFFSHTGYMYRGV